MHRCRVLESASDITRKAGFSAERAYDQYLSYNRNEIATKSDVNWLTIPGDTDAIQVQRKGLALGKRIATNQRLAVVRMYHCGWYLWVASSKAIVSLRKDVN